MERHNLGVTRRQLLVGGAIAAAGASLSLSGISCPSGVKKLREQLLGAEPLPGSKKGIDPAFGELVVSRATRNERLSHMLAELEDEREAHEDEHGKFAAIKGATRRALEEVKEFGSAAKEKAGVLKNRTKQWIVRVGDKAEEWARSVAGEIAEEIAERYRLGDGLESLVELSDEKCVALALAVVTEHDAQNLVVDPSQEVAQRVQRLYTQLPEKYQRRIRSLKVIDSSEENAFATADGSIRILRGLADSLTDEELKGVLYHETGHIEKKHTHKLLSSALKTQIVRDAVLIRSADDDGGISIVVALSAVIGQAVSNAHYSQDNEIEADRFAVRALEEDGTGSEPFVAYFERIGNDGGLLPFLRSHPPSPKRVKMMREEQAAVRLERAKAL